MIVYTCPKCGQPLTDGVICTMPPISVKRCFACGWYYESNADREIQYVKFEPPKEREE